MSTIPKKLPASQGASAKECEEHFERAKAHLEAGDRNAEKAAQHYCSAGQHLRSIKELSPDQKTFLAAVEKKLHLGKTRVYELLKIADGTTTVAETRKATNKRTQKSLAKKKLSANSGQDAKKGSKKAALAWSEEHEFGFDAWQDDVGSYRVHVSPDEDGGYTASLCDGFNELGEPVEFGKYKTAKAAKAACERDWQARPAAPATTKPKAPALVWKRGGDGTEAKRRGGTYRPYKDRDGNGDDLYRTIFWPTKVKEGDPHCFSIGESWSLRAAKALAQTHADAATAGATTEAPAAAPVTEVSAPAPVITAEGEKPSYRDLELKIVGLESEIADLKDQMKASGSRLIDAVKVIVDSGADEWGSVADLRKPLIKRLTPVLADLRKFAAPAVKETTTTTTPSVVASMGAQEIKTPKYADGYDWSVVGGDTVLKNSGPRFATEELARSAAQAAIAEVDA